MNNTSTSTKKHTIPYPPFLKLKNLIALISILLFMTFAACRDRPDSTQAGSETLDNTTIPAKLVVNQESEGFTLLKTNCYVCHNPNITSHDEILAPPLAGVKKRYQMATSSREEFIAKVSAFVADPKASTALMKGPVNRFGVMPKPNVKPEDIKKIVEFIYDNPIEEPSWFAEHHEEMNNH